MIKMTIYCIMESGQVIRWHGRADDQDHAEGLAMDKAKRLTNEQVIELLTREQMQERRALAKRLIDK